MNRVVRPNVRVSAPLRNPAMETPSRLPRRSVSVARPLATRVRTEYRSWILSLFLFHARSTVLVVSLMAVALVPAAPTCVAPPVRAMAATPAMTAGFKRRLPAVCYVIRPTLSA